jgi:hypothetical protein
MSEKELNKKAYKLAEEELEQEKIERVKEVVRATLERLEILKKRKKEIEGEMKILRMDLDDLREGHLDRIEERQKKDEKAKEISVVKVIEKVVEREVKPPYWYKHYTLQWPTDPYIVYCGNQTVSSDSAYTVGSTFNSCVVSNSFAKNNVPGAYEIGDKIIHFR